MCGTWMLGSAGVSGSWTEEILQDGRPRESDRWSIRERHGTDSARRGQHCRSVLRPHHARGMRFTNFISPCTRYGIHKPHRAQVWDNVDEVDTSAEHVSCRSHRKAQLSKVLNGVERFATSLTTTGTHMASQCYLPPGRGDIPAFTPVSWSLG